MWREADVVNPEVDARSGITPASVLVPALLVILLIRTGRGGLALVVTVVALFATQLSSLRVVWWEDALHRVGRVVGRSLAVVLLGAASLLIFWPVAGLLRCVRLDPLDMSGRRGWIPVPLPRAARFDRRSFARQARAGHLQRVKAFGAVALAAAVVAATAALISTDFPVGGGDGPPGESLAAHRHSLIAHQDSPWAEDLFEEEYELRNFYDPYLAIRPGDHEGRHINVTDGVRRSYEGPDAGADDALEVWFFGASTLFGIGQRDLHTIPSGVTRLAQRDGIALRSINFGMSSYVNWQETLLFAAELADRPAPDLVVFYDGSNDQYVYTGAAATDSPTHSFVAEVEGALLAAGALISPTPPNPVRTQEQAHDDFITAYERGARVARWLGEAAGVRVMHFFQPSLSTKEPLTRADLAAYALAGYDRDQATQEHELVTQLVLPNLPSGTIDLTGALDGIEDAVYFDTAHTNEIGAHTVAEAMYAHLRPVALALAQDDG